MKNAFLFFIAFCICGLLQAQIPTLGTYAPAAISAGGNINITPTSAPAIATSITAAAPANFKGVLSVNPVTGVVRIINAQPAGIYTISLKAFSSSGMVGGNFTLTVTNPLCSSGIYTTSGDFLSLPQNNRVTAIGDFNNDGRQDLAIAYDANNSIQIRVGNGTGSFNALATVNVGTALATAVTIADFNGDGNQDLATVNSSYVAVRLGNGNGTFSNAPDVTNLSGAYAIATADFNNDGKLDLAISNLGNSTISIRLGDGAGNFSGTTSLTTSGAFRTVVAADFNNDGNADVAVVNSGNVTVYRGNGASSFTISSGTSVGSALTFIVADFNNDGKADIAAPDISNGQIIIRLGNGAGGFTNGTNVSAIEQSIIATGDFNGDGNADLIMAPSTNSTMYVRLGDGTGGFGFASPVYINNGTNTIVTGDFNNDGYQDFATGNTNTSGAIRLGNAINAEINVQGNNTNIPDGNNNPGFADSTDFGGIGNVKRTFRIQNTGNANLAVSSISIAGADAAAFTVSGISFPAIVTPGVSTSFTVTFLPAAAGIKNAIVNINNSDCDEAVYDFAIRGTGVTPSLGTYRDTLVATAGGGIIINPSAMPGATPILYASTSTSFKGQMQVNPATGRLIITNAHPAGVYTINLKAVNGLLTATQSFTLTVGNTGCSPGKLVAFTTTASGTGIGDLAVGDFNNDGKPDIASVNPGSYNLTVSFGNGSGGFSSSSYVSGGFNTPMSLVADDINGDGNLDFAVANNTGSRVSVYLGNGAGGFISAGDVSPLNYPRSIALGDFNGDGKKDMAIAGSYSSIGIWLGNGAGGFTGYTSVPVSSDSYCVALGDFNTDGKLDLASAGYSSGNISIRFGDGNGNFSGTANYTVGANPQSVVIGDFNNDGKQDFASANYGGNNLSIRLGDGAGNFTGTTNLPMTNNPYNVAIGDFNGDGNQDVAATNYSPPNTAIHFGDGAGGFTGIYNIAGNFPKAIVIADLNLDGKQDIITSYGSSDFIPYLGIGSEINVQGNNRNIPDGNTVVSAADYTNLGNVANGGSLSRNYLVQNIGTDTLTVSAINLVGTDVTSFTVSGITLPARITPGQQLSFTVRFAPQSTGTRSAEVNIINTDCDETVYNFAIQATGGFPAAALNLDGVNDYISINDTTGNIGSSNATLSAWIKTTGVSASIISKRNTCGAGNFFDFGITATGRLFVQFDNNSSPTQLVTGSSIIANGVWHQVVAVRKADSVFLYVDGVQDAAQKTVGIAAISNTAPLLIGASGCGSASGFFSGSIDEVRLYSRALSTAEIQTNVSCELTSTQTGLLAYYRFNQGNALESNTAISTLADSSGRGNTGQLMNFALTGATSNWVLQGAVSTGISCTGRSIWLGLSSNWDDPANWSGGFAPLEFTRVVINSDVASMPEVTSPNSSCYSVTLNNGATVTIRTGGHLHITSGN